MSCGLGSAKTPSIRHCALCLTEISGKAILKCGKCLKRAYCSKDCQTADWSPKKNGQGHKNWCGIDCGEEDVEWSVTPITGKGLGIVALRDIPALYRIIVEPKVDIMDPRIGDLMPSGGSILDKFRLNKLGCGIGDPDNDEDGNSCTVPIPSMLFLRMARVNHSCAPNASHYYDSTLKVKILSSLRDIKRGEEICIAYAGMDYIGESMGPVVAREVLKSKWGIICDEKSCLCYDKAYNAKLKELKELDDEIIRLRYNPVAALVLVKKLLELEKELNLLQVRMTRSLFDAFEIAITNESTVKVGLEFVAEAYELAKRIAHPELNGLVKKYKKYMENPSSHLFYLMNKSTK